MTPFLFVVSVLAVWRVTHLLQAEDGPWDAIVGIRKAVGNGFLGSLMDCFYCLSLWMALPLGIYFGKDRIEKVLLWLALSGGASLLEKMSTSDREG
jgi:hypothetical protein